MQRPAPAAAGQLTCQRTLIVSGLGSQDCCQATLGVANFGTIRGDTMKSFSTNGGAVQVPVFALRAQSHTAHDVCIRS